MIRTFDTPINTNDQSIDRVLAAGLPVVLIFLSGEPGAALQQTMDRLARENAGRILVALVQVKDNPATTARYRIQRPPALVTIRDGQVLSQKESITAADLEKHVAYLLGKGPKPEEPPPPSAGTTQSTQTRAGTAYGKPQATTDTTFEQDVIRSELPVLVDFWAPWCGPCRMTDPILEKMAGEMAGRLKIVKVNADENPLSIQRFGVQGIPTMLLVKNGQVVDRMVGALPEPAIRSRIAAVV